MPRLYNKQTNTLLGNISDADVQFLVDQLEEENLGDRDYFIDEATVAILEENGGSQTLIDLLRATVDASDGLEVKYEK